MMALRVLRDHDPGW